MFKKQLIPYLYLRISIAKIASISSESGPNVIHIFERNFQTTRIEILGRFGRPFLYSTDLSHIVYKLRTVTSKRLYNHVRHKIMVP